MGETHRKESDKMGSKIEIDAEQVEKLASRFWKNTEIAAFFGCDEGTIRKRFPNELIKGRESGKGKLRDAQLAAAFKGSAAMLIWLGKQYLEQSEKMSVEHSEIWKGSLEIIEEKDKSDLREKVAKFLN